MVVACFISIVMLALALDGARRDGRRAYARGYAAAVDSCAQRDSNAVLRLSPGALAAQALDIYGARYTITVRGWDRDSARTNIHFGDFGKEARR
jgi:hypothetical protein